MAFFQSNLRGVFNFFRGMDRFTRTPVFQDNQWSDGLSKNYLEQYVTIDNQEYNLYKTTAELAIVVNRKAEMFANGVFVVKNYKTGDIIENHPILKVLENPNSTQDRNLFLMNTSVNMSLYGNHFIFKNQGTKLSEFPSNLVNLPAGRMVIDRKAKKYRNVDLNDIIKNYIVRDFSGSDEVFEVDEVIHFKTVNPDDDILGLSPLHPLQAPISNTRGAYGFRNVNITERGALGIISPKDNAMGALQLLEEDRLEISKQYTETHGIFDRQARVKFSPKAIDYTTTSFGIKDSMVFEEVSENFMKFIDMYGMNIYLFSQNKGTTFTNLKEGEKMAYQDTIIPFSERFCYKLNTDLGLFDKGYYIELSYADIPCLAENEKDRAFANKMKVEAYVNLINNGFAPEEARRITEL